MELKVAATLIVVLMVCMIGSSYIRDTLPFSYERSPWYIGYACAGVVALIGIIGCVLFSVWFA